MGGRTIDRTDRPDSLVQTRFDLTESFDITNTRKVCLRTWFYHFVFSSISINDLE